MSPRFRTSRASREERLSFGPRPRWGDDNGGALAELAWLEQRGLACAFGQQQVRRPEPADGIVIGTLRCASRSRRALGARARNNSEETLFSTETRVVLFLEREDSSGRCHRPMSNATTTHRCTSSLRRPLHAEHVQRLQLPVDGVTRFTQPFANFSGARIRVRRQVVEDLQPQRRHGVAAAPDGEPYGGWSMPATPMRRRNRGPETPHTTSKDG